MRYHLLCSVAVLLLSSNAGAFRIDGLPSYPGVQYEVDVAGDVAGADTSYQGGAEQYCQDTYAMSLATFFNERMYREFIDEITSIADNEVLFLGLVKAAGDPYLRTLGDSVTSFVNFPDSTVVSKANEACVLLQVDSSLPDLAFSPWLFTTDCSSTSGAPNRGVVCSNQTQSVCTTDFNDNCGAVGPAERDELGMCFFQPHPGQVQEKKVAEAVCRAGGGFLLALFDSSDYDYVKDTLGLIDDTSSTNMYWLGLSQAPDTGAPRWRNGSVTYFDQWSDDVNFFSSLSPVGYTGLLLAQDGRWNLYPDAPVIPLPNGDASRLQRQALTICEAPKAAFCLANAPSLEHATHDASCCDGTITYQCDVGWEFEDGSVTRTYTCDGSCNPQYIRWAIKAFLRQCVVRNPCKDYPSPCGAYAECVFTNEVERPYHCSCLPGYRLYQGYCIDINECDEGNPCQVVGPYGGCINTRGSYECYCTHKGHCTGVGRSSSTITVLFTIDLEFEEEFSDRYNPEYRALYDTFLQIVRQTMGRVVSLAELGISIGHEGTLITLELTAAGGLRLDDLSARLFALKQALRQGVLASGSFYQLSSQVYFYTQGKQIGVTSLCSIYEATEYCWNAPCQEEDGLPVCRCPDGYYGPQCGEVSPGAVSERKQDEELSGVEVGLITGLCLLAAFTLLLMLCVCLTNTSLRHGITSKMAARHKLRDADVYVTHPPVFTRTHGVWAGLPVQGPVASVMWSNRPTLTNL